MTLEFRAFCWLRFEKRCRIVLHERGPREFWNGRPDALGITDSRHLLEIEIKRTLSDFRANTKKAHIQRRDLFLQHAPKLYWFLVPPELADRVKPELPEYAGLLTGSSETHGWLTVVKPARTNPESKRLSVKECVRVVQSQSNQVLSLWQQVESNRNRAEWDATCPFGVDYQI